MDSTCQPLSSGYTRNTVILAVLALTESTAIWCEKRLSLSLPLLWLCDAYMSSWGVTLLATVPCPPLLSPICCEVCTHHPCSCLLRQQPGRAVENLNSPLGTWEPHTSLSWWFCCFVLFKQYEDNTSSVGPGRNGSKHCLCRLIGSISITGQSFSSWLHLGGHGRYN